MRGKGINYDTGFSPGGHDSREHFDAGIVRGEMRVIARELGCTAVRVSGGEANLARLAGAESAELQNPDGWMGDPALHIRVRRDRKLVVMQALLNAGVAIRDFRSEAPTLEAIFARLISQPAQEQRTENKEQRLATT